MIFDFVENSAEAAGIAREVLVLADRYHIAVNPIHYAVLYVYISGRSPELNSALDQAFRDDSALAPELLRKLYNTYLIDADTQAVELLRSALVQVMDSTGEALQQIDGDSKTFDAQLGECVQRLNSVDTEGQLNELVSSLREQTRMMQQSGSVLRSELDEAHGELANLLDEFTRVHQESLLDPLTGISNRRAFDQALDAAVKTHARESQPMCLLLLDLDHFKRINDLHGHIIGDAVLKWFAKILKETVRGNDQVARYGGEEFAVLLPDTSLSGARIVAENIRRRAAGQNLRVGRCVIGKVTCSIGVAALAGEWDVRLWVAKADGAMYKAKDAGRDKVLVNGL